MKAENIILLGGLGLIFYWLYSKDKDNSSSVEVVDIEPIKVNKVDIKSIKESEPTITSDEPTKIDTKAKTIVLDLNAQERKKFSQRVPDAIVKDYDTSLNKTITRNQQTLIEINTI